MQSARQLQSRLDCKTLILMYHSVAEVSSDPWSLCVTPRHFGEQLEVLRKKTDPIRLQELTGGLRKVGSSRHAVVVTFDDGYANNLQNAKPLLTQHEMSATVFLATGYLGGQYEFWWDELDRIFLQPGTLPEGLQLSIDGSTHEWELGGEANFNEQTSYRHRIWRAWEEPPTSRHSLYISVWQLLKGLREDERQSVLGELRAWANETSKRRQTHRPLSFEELSELTKGDLIEIGCHTVTHSALSTLSVADQRKEIQGSKKCLEEITCRPITSFAYPYGSNRDYTIDTVRLVEEAGFDCACSTSPTVVTKDSSKFELPRLQVQDWDGDEFSRQLSLWFAA